MTNGALIESWPIDRLRSHPENATIFGDPEESKAYLEVLGSIKKHGIWEPLLVKKDGTILSGHLRCACAKSLGLETVPVRVWDAFTSYLDEVRFVVRSNTDRRQLTPQQIAYAFKRLKEIPKAEGGAKAKMGRPKGDEKKSAESRPLSRSRDDAAEQLGVSRDIAESLEAVFTTPGVPDELKSAVNDGRVAPTTAAKEVRAEAKRQGGTITNPAPLADVAERKATDKSAHQAHVADAAKSYRDDVRRLLEAYRAVDAALTKRPLASVIGPTEHHEYGDLCRDIAIRAWREVETVEGVTNAGKQMALAVIKGGRS